MTAAVLSLLLTHAPVPTHLMRGPDPSSVAPGWRWYYVEESHLVTRTGEGEYTATTVRTRYELEVASIDGDVVTYWCPEWPTRTWNGNTQTVAATLAEAKRYGRPPPPGSEP